MSHEASHKSQPNPLWSDDPIESDEQDSLKRERFVSMVADRLNACELGQSSTVFGLVGPWGSGKTSLINLITTQLDTTWKVAVFSPWATSDVNGLQREFLAALASVFEEGQGDEHSAAKAAVKKYSKVCTPLLKAVPIVGTALAEVTQEGIDLATASKPWHIEFDEATKTFKNLGLKVLIVADDIDRLDPEEVICLLKVIRLLGRFPNVHYFIAYDQTTIEELLNEKGLGTKSSVFMEKIVQYPFEVPPIASAIQRRQFTETVSIMLSENNISISSSSADRLSELAAALAPSFVTPRAHTRFREQLLSFAAMVSFEEIDAVDYIALSFLRVFYHDVYEQLAPWKAALQSGKISHGLFDSSELSDSDWNEKIRPLVNSENDIPLVKEVLSSLFPGISSHGLLFFREHPLALSNNLYFQRYFILDVAEDDIEDRLIANAIGSILGPTDGVSMKIDAVAEYTKIIDGTDSQRAALAIEKGEQFRRTQTSSSPALVQFLLERLLARPEADDGFASPKRALRRWVENEVYRALELEDFSALDLAADMSQDELLLFTIRGLSNPRVSEKQAQEIFKDLSDHFLNILTNKLNEALDSGVNLPYLVEVSWRLTGGNEGDSRVSKIGANLTASGDVEFLERVVSGFVFLNKWQGMDGLRPELAFNRQAMRYLFDHEQVRQIAEMLPAARTLSDIDIENTSSENIRDFARANLNAAVAHN